MNNVNGGIGCNKLPGFGCQKLIVGLHFILMVYEKIRLLYSTHLEVSPRADPVGRVLTDRVYAGHSDCGKAHAALAYDAYCRTLGNNNH